jgi:hypothetical protein
MKSCFSFFMLGLLSSACATPYPDPQQVPRDKSEKMHLMPAARVRAEELRARAQEVLRVDVDWTEAGEVYQAARIWSERSGTDALKERAQVVDPMGSYRGTLRSASTGQVLGHDSLGTGKEFRKLVRTLAFRFPIAVREDWIFELTAEHPVTGEMQKVLEQPLKPAQVVAVPELPEEQIEVRTLRKAKAPNALVLGIYAEGFFPARAKIFWDAAERAARAFEGWKFPMLDNLEIVGVFVASNQALGSAKNLGLPVPERDSFLGLYFPYWNSFGRWFHIVFPTRESKFRNGLAQIPYDYPLVIVDSDEFWGVGNYKELTAIPAEDRSFTYLLMHEFGHFMGLNEEYEGGGRTELEFAPQIQEPWSPNITFLRSTSWKELKWNAFVSQSTPLPTPGSSWRAGRYGA